MSMLTQAATETYRPAGLRATAVVGLVAMTVAATILLLLHVQLRFAISDLNIQTRKLQKEMNGKDGLENRRAPLRSKVEGLKAGDRILKYATEVLGMVPYDPAQAATLTLSNQRLQTWRECKASPGPEERSHATRQVAGNAPKGGGRESIETMLQALKSRLAARQPAKF